MERHKVTESMGRKIKAMEAGFCIRIPFSLNRSYSDTTCKKEDFGEIDLAWLWLLWNEAWRSIASAEISHKVKISLLNVSIEYLLSHFAVELHQLNLSFGCCFATQEMASTQIVTWHRSQRGCSGDMGCLPGSLQAVYGHSWALCHRVDLPSLWARGVSAAHPVCLSHSAECQNTSSYHLQ